MSSLLDPEPKQEDSHMAPEGDFIFQQSLAVHQGSVRCLAVLEGSNRFVSGSIDNSVKQYNASPTQVGHYDFDREFTYHESFVYALCPHIE